MILYKYRIIKTGGKTMKKIQPRKWLKDLRRELGLKIAEFSKRTVLSFPSFQKLESGETVNMKPETI